MRILSRYLLRELAAPFVFALGALTSMLLLNQIAKRFGDLVGKGLSASVIAEVLLLSLPFIIALTLPMAVLVAVLYGFSHLAADNEITAMRASGVSVAQMLRPGVLAGVLVSGFNFFFIDQVLPRSNTRLVTLQMDIGRKKPTLAMREQALNPLQGTDYFLRASRIEAGTGRMRDVTIYDLTLPNVRRVVYADSGIMLFEANGRDLQLHLYSGAVHEYRPEEIGTVRVTVYEQNIIRARDVANKLELGTSQFERGDRELSTCEMIDRRDLQQRGALRAFRIREQYTRRDLRSVLRLAAAVDDPVPEPETRRHCGRLREVEDFLGRYIFPAKAAAQTAAQNPTAAGGDSAGRRGVTVPPPAARAIGPVVLSSLSSIAEMGSEQVMDGRSANRLGVEIHKKFTISLACLNFVIIGIALALRFPRGGIGLVLGGSMIIFTLFYICLTAGEEFADRGIMTPATAMWAPNVIIAVIGLVGIRAASRAMGTSRGGDLADLGDVLVGWLRRRRA